MYNNNNNNNCLNLHYIVQLVPYHNDGMRTKMIAEKKLKIKNSREKKRRAIFNIGLVWKKKKNKIRSRSFI